MNVDTTVTEDRRAEISHSRKHTLTHTYARTRAHTHARTHAQVSWNNNQAEQGIKVNAN